MRGLRPEPVSGRKGKDYVNIGQTAAPSAASYGQGEYMSQVTMKQLLEAGVHFGHQTSRWNPKMRPYIFGARNGIHIIDLQQTVTMFRDACGFIQEVAACGGAVLFVGTKKQAQEPIKGEAERVKQPYVNNRWLGGTLTNFQTIKQSIERLKKLEESLADPDYAGELKKKERLMIQREIDKLRVNLDGIRDMKRLPDALFVIDPDREAIAVAEANRLRIPVIAVVDTNCNPDNIAYCIPGNDDAIRAIRLFCQAAADSVSAGVDEHAERSKATADLAGAFQASDAAVVTSAGLPGAEPETPAVDATAAGETPATSTPGTSTPTTDTPTDTQGETPGDTPATEPTEVAAKNEPKTEAASEAPASEAPVTESAPTDTAAPSGGVEPAVAVPAEAAAEGSK